MGAVFSCIPRRHHDRGPARRSSGTLSLVDGVATVSLNQNTCSKADLSKPGAAVTVQAIDSNNDVDKPITAQTEARTANEHSAEANQTPTTPEPKPTGSTTGPPKSPWSQAWTWCTKPLPRSKSSSARKPEPYILLPRIYPAMPPAPPSHAPNHPSPAIAAQLMPIDPSNPYIAAEITFLLARRAELREIKRARWEAVRIEARWARVRRGEWEGGEGERKTFVRLDMSGKVKMRPLRTVEEQGVWIEGRRGAMETKGDGEGEDEEKEEEEGGDARTGV